MKNYCGVFVIFSFLCLFESGLCIDCHQCASKDGTSCLDPYDGDEQSDNVDECGPKDTHCSKYKMVSFLQDSGFILGDPRETVTVTRGCIRADDTADYCKFIQADSSLFFKCICSGDGCNSGRSVVSNSLLTLITVVAAISFRGGW